MSLNFENVRRALLKESAAGESAEASLEKTFSDEEESGDEIEAKKDAAEFSNEARRWSLKMLLEQEDEEDEGAEDEGDEGEDEDAGDDEAAGDEAGDDPDAGAAGDEADEETDEEDPEEEVEEVTPEETAELGKSVDDALESILVDYESKARKSAAIQTESRYSLRRYLITEEAGMIDVDKFTTDVARLVMNYDSLLDMEAIIVNKAIQFLTSHYNEEVAEEFLELLDIKHGIAIGEEEELEVPLAGGASGGGGGGGGAI